MGARVVVVGGGMAGLAAAHELLRARPDLDLLLLDGSDRPGGKARRVEVGGIGIDVGAESVLTSSTHAARLADELGLRERLVHPEPVAAALWTRGALHRMPAGTFMGVPGSSAALTGPLTDDEVARAAAPEAPVASEGDRSIADAVGTTFGPAVVDRVVEPILGGVYAGRVEHLSVQAAMPALWPAVRDGVPLTEAVDDLLPQPSDPPRPPRLIGLDGGITSLAEHLVAAITEAGGRILTGTLARELRRTPTRWRVVSGPTTDPVAHDADAVVLATPAAPSARLLTDHAPGASRALADIEHASMAVVALALPRTPATTALPGSGFLVPAVDGRAIKAATFITAKWAWAEREAARQDVVLVRASMGRAGDVTTLQREDGDLVRDAVADIGAALGRELPDPVDAHVQRWGGGLPQYTVGHRDRIERVRAAVAGLPGLEVAGAAYDGVGIAAVLSTADQAVRGVLDALPATSDRTTATPTTTATATTAITTTAITTTEETR